MFDDFGRYYGDTVALYSAAFPIQTKEMTRAVFVKALNELAAVDCIRFYESEGRHYVYVPSWDKHQKRRAKESRFPDPPEPTTDGLPTSANICSQTPTNVPVVVDVVVDGDGGDRSALRAGRSPDGFEQFWNSYPPTRRRGRQEAVEAWRSLRLTPAQVRQVFTSLASWKASEDWQKDDGKYIPWPQKFLRKRRWEEIVEPTRQRQLTTADLLGER